MIRAKRPSLGTLRHAVWLPQLARRDSVWKREFGRDAALAAIEAHVIGSAIRHDGLIIDIRNSYVFYVVDCAIVKKGAILPAIACTGVTAAVINSAVEADRPEAYIVPL